MKDKKRKKISLKWKIFGGFLIFTAILLVILWILQIVCLNDFYIYIKRGETRDVTEEVKALLVDALDVEDTTLQSSLEKIAQESGTSIILTDTEGATLYSADYNFRGSMDSLPQEVYQKYYEKAVENGGEAEVEFEGSTVPQPDMNPGSIAPPSDTQGSASERTGDTQSETTDASTDGTSKSNVIERNATDIDSTDNNAIDGSVAQGAPASEGAAVQPGDDGKVDQSVIYVCVVPMQEQEVVLYVNSMLTPIDATVSTLKAQFVLLTVVLIGISLLIAWLASRAISRSLISLNASARRLADGDYEVHFTENDYDEVAQLSDTLNYAVGELKKTEDLRKELIANVSHDLRTPLTMMKAYSEVMRDIPEETTPENVQVIIDETDRLTGLVNDMLSVSQLEAGTIVLDSDDYDLTESIEAIVARYNKLREQDGYKLSFSYEKHVGVHADEDKMSQVICNLINNAINYTGEDKRVILQQTVHHGSVRIDVIDTGEGIAQADIPYVWDRYYKGDKARKRLVSGTGLGLSIVQKILELHGAAYGVESKPGMGADFWFEMKCMER